eukprot:CAMPEP_0181078158 /NCGR_PEP_ID=MMETSP1071-20121207/1336_1 /TAXON_ID=35127 /ORGANISM="Thalassiosira sp., Strain NH16" /LENGTH=45 /DNA_ID= /DNA_START= /DNA_END= /DNA_ORIENTATION=
MTEESSSNAPTISRLVMSLDLRQRLGGGPAISFDFLFVDTVLPCL